MLVHGVTRDRMAKFVGEFPEHSASEGNRLLAVRQDRLSHFDDGFRNAVAHLKDAWGGVCHNADDKQF